MVVYFQSIICSLYFCIVDDLPPSGFHGVGYVVEAGVILGWSSFVCTYTQTSSCSFISFDEEDVFFGVCVVGN